MDKEKIIRQCRGLLRAYQDGGLGQTKMPEDANPGFSAEQTEERLIYFTLPMALNYQRDSYKLWQATLSSYQDAQTKDIFSVKNSAQMSADDLRAKLMKYKLALQPQRHLEIWQTLAKTIYQNWGSLSNLFVSVENDFLKLKESIQVKHKKNFPYLSGPKIFNYWSFVMTKYGGVDLKNKQFIEIAPDTHIIKGSVILGVISEPEAEHLSREEISQRWREILENSGIAPIEMHPPLWFWSRNGFRYQI